MAEFPAMPFFWSEFFADTEDLSPDAAKAYVFLLGHAWIRQARLPNDDLVLSRLARVSPKVWSGMKNSVLGKWQLGDDGYWRQKRLTKEWDFVCRKKEVNSKNGSLGGKATHAKKSNEINKSDQANAQAPTPTPIVSKETSEAKASSSKKNQKKRKSQIPEDWTPGRDGVDYAVKRCELPEHLVTIEAERFVNHHRAKGNTFADHMRAWQTWCRNYQQFNNRGANGRRQDEPYVNPHAQLVTEWVRELDKIPDDRDDTAQGGDPGEPDSKAIALH